MKYIGICCLLLFSLLAPGEVFTLWPVRGSGGTDHPGIFLNHLPLTELHKERFIANGVSLDMTVFKCAESFEMLLAELRKKFSKEDFVCEGTTVRVGYSIGRGMAERWLLIREKNGRTTVFKIVAPEILPPPGEWPRELPQLPPGAEIKQILQFPERRSIYGAFQKAEHSPQEILRQQSRVLESDGWIAVGAEAALQEGGRGDLFIRTRSGREIIWLNAGEEGTGNCYYKRAE